MSPKLLCPYPSITNPHAKEVMSKVHERWIDLLRLRPADHDYRKLLDGRFGEFSSRCFPNAKQRELEIAMHFGVFGFFWDDVYELPELHGKEEKIRALNTRALEILRGMRPTPEDDPMLWILADVHDGMKSLMPREWILRFANHTEIFFESSLQEAMNRYRHRIPPLNTYIQMRRQTVCMVPTYDLVELAEGICLPVEVRESRIVAGMEEACMDAVAWANDIFSAEKEEMIGDFHNLVLLFQHQHRLSRQEAMQRVAEMHDAKVLRFMELERDLPSFGPDLDEQVVRYIHGMKCVMKANHEWSMLTNRYLPRGLQEARRQSHDSM